MKFESWYLYIIGVVIVIWVLWKWNTFFTEPFDSFVDGSMKGFYINMDKNKHRDESFKKAIEKTDLNNIEVSRYSAVVGKNVNLSEWLTPTAVKELNEVEHTGYRTRHYQLTRGGVGCFLSHYNLAKKLVADNSAEYYLVMEDDIHIHPQAYSNLKRHISQAPQGWDMLLFGYIRLVEKNKIGNSWIKPRAFWGTHGYVINKSGAGKLVQEVERAKIDGQIDSYISRMCQKDMFNVYASTHILFKPAQLGTDIQIPLVVKKGVDPFDFGGYKV